MVCDYASRKGQRSDVSNDMKTNPPWNVKKSVKNHPLQNYAADKYGGKRPETRNLLDAARELVRVVRSSGHKKNFRSYALDLDPTAFEYLLRKHKFHGKDECEYDYRQLVKRFFFTLLSAIEKGDARFFKDIAKLIEKPQSVSAFQKMVIDNLHPEGHPARTLPPSNEVKIADQVEKFYKDNSGSEISDVRERRRIGKMAGLKGRKAGRPKSQSQ